MLGDHLVGGNLFHPYFDLKNWNYLVKAPEVESEDNHAYCGTAGCSLGEMPLLDKVWWTFEKEYHYPVLRNEFLRIESLRCMSANSYPIKSAMIYFEISEEQALFLFNPWAYLENSERDHPMKESIQNDLFITEMDAGLLILDFVSSMEVISRNEKQILAGVR